MRALTSVDALFLASESRRAPSNVSSLAVLERLRADGTPLTVDHLREVFAERLHLLEPLRWRLVEAPFGVAHPWWIETDVDLEFHVREIALPPPADERTFTDHVARLAATPMDRDRPLWEAYLIHGVPDDRLALLTKFHHAAMDGVSGAEVMSVLLDGDATGRDIAPRGPDPTPERVPSRLSLLARGVADLPRQPLRWIVGGRRALPHVDEIPQIRSVPGVRTSGAAARTILRRAGDDDRGAQPSPSVPRMPFNDRVSPRRRLELVTLPLPDVKALKNVFGTTVNDVIVALCAGALRTWLDDAGELPEEPMVAIVPVSVRPPDQQGAFGNAVSGIVTVLPTDDPDPVSRLEACRDGLRQAKQRFGAVPATLMRDANDMVPPMLFGPAMRTILRLGSSSVAEPPANLVISNVPGSRSPLYCAGARVVAHYPVSVLADSLGLNITLFSYVDRLDVGLLADPELVDDLEGLAAALVDELAGLLAAAAAREDDDS